MSESGQGGAGGYGVPSPGTDRIGFARSGFADQLSIETPEQVGLTFPVAGIGSRFVAVLVDHLIQFGVVLLVVLLTVVLHAALGSRWGFESLANKWFAAVSIFLFFLLFWGYFALFEAFWRGQTPGKRLMKLRVIQDTGRQITPFESLARNLLRLADFLPNLYLAGVITMLANKRNKRLGDLAAGTLVIHERTDDQPLLYTGYATGYAGTSTAPGLSTPEASWNTPREAVELFPADAITRLGSRNLILIEAFLARVLDLPLDTRAAMAERILGELTRQMGVPLPAGNPERALEAIGVALRRQRRRL